MIGFAQTGGRLSGLYSIRHSRTAGVSGRVACIDPERVSSDGRRIDGAPAGNGTRATDYPGAAIKA